MENLEAIIDKINELFITVRYKYIKQNKDFGYTTYNIYTNKKHVSLNDQFIKAHLMRKSTYGIFCRRRYTKFITFDVDVPDINNAKKVVLAIYDSLNSFGIPTEKIHTSWSGTKGFHVDVYFSKEILYKQMEKLYNATVHSTYNLLNGFIDGKIEKRPSPTQGLKLPLSVNFKNQNTSNSVCWYVDVYNNFTPIRSLEYILTIEPIDADIIKDLIDDLPEDIVEGHNSKNQKQSKGSKGKSTGENTKHSKSENQNQLGISQDLPNVDLSEDSLNSLKKLYEEGLKKLGTRNASLCKLAIYFNTLKEPKKECEQKLREWMAKQNREYYKTPLEICYKEITRIVNIIYKKNIVLSNGKREIQVTKSEILTIYQYPKKLHSTIAALLFHSKCFEDIDGKFFMTYEQIAAAAQCSIRAAINHISTLEHLNLIKVTRIQIDHIPEHYPNTYGLKLHWLKAENEITVTTEIKNVENYSKVKIDLILKTFPDNEWWNISKLVKRAKDKQKEHIYTKK